MLGVISEKSSVGGYGRFCFFAFEKSKCDERTIEKKKNQIEMDNQKSLFWFMAFDNVVAAGSAETLLVFSFFFRKVLFHDSHQKSLLSLYLLPNLSTPPLITTPIVKSFFYDLVKKHTRNMPSTCRGGKKREASAFVRYTRPSIITHPQLWIIKKSTAIFPLKKRNKKFLNCHFHSFRLSNRKRKTKKKKSFPQYIFLITSDWYHPPYF